MRQVIASGTDLRSAAEGVQRLLSDLVQVLASVQAAFQDVPAQQSGVVPALWRAQRAGQECFGQVQALAMMMALAAHRYDVVERDVTAGFGAVTQSWPGGSGSWPGEPGWRPPLTGRELTGGFIGDVTRTPSATMIRLLSQSDPQQLAALLQTYPELAQLGVQQEDIHLPEGVGGLTRLAELAAGSTPMSRAFRGQALADQRLLLAELASLAPAQRRMVALLSPRLIASIPSAPPADRMAATRVLIAADLARLLGVVRQARSPQERAQVARKIDQRRAWLEDSVALRHPDGTVARRPHQLLWFDPRGDGQIIEVLGDFDRATHLAVFVPATGSDLNRQPETLRHMVHWAQADPRVAVVLWQGADHPDQPFDDGVFPLREHVFAAAYRDSADLAGPALARDVEGLRLAMPRAGADLSVLGHSYGGSIIGSAEQAGMIPDRVVHIGSAGGYTQDPMPDLPGQSGPRRFSMTAPDDPIQFAQGNDLSDGPQLAAELAPPITIPLAVGAAAVLPFFVEKSQIGHGADPDLMPGVIRLETGRVDATGRLVHGHSGMFAPGSTAWRNLHEVMRGGPVEVFEPQLWRVRLERAELDPDAPNGVVPPRYVIASSPWSDPAYRPPVVPSR